MNSSTKKVNISLFLVCIFIGAGVSVKNKDKNDAIACTANAAVHSGERVLKASINYNLSSGNGFVNINGFIFDKEGKKTKVSIKKSFAYYKNDDLYTFHQDMNDANDESVDNMELLNQIIPDFYIKTTPLLHHLNIEEIRPGLWIFSASRTPYFTCIDY